MRLQPHQLRSLQANGLGSPLPAPVAKKKRSQEESQMQRALIQWWHLACRRFGVAEALLFSIPNGGARTAITGAILKAEGARKGAPDLMLAVPRRPRHSSMFTIEHYAALFLELKRRDGVLSPEQKTFHALLQSQGYKVVVCWSLQECIDEITTYLTA